MNCDIVMPVYNQLEYTLPCLESIKKYSAYINKVIIVDDCSNDETQKYLEKLHKKSEIYLVRNEANLGWLKSVNKGFNQAKAGYVCLMNNDTLVTEGWLEEMIRIGQREKDIGLLNPSWEKPNNISLEEYANRIKKFSGQYIETDWARGFCILIKREVIDRIGGFDEVFSPGYFDDHDFSVRAIREGYRCVRATASFVLHYRNITFKKKLNNERFNQLFERNRGTFYKKWGKPLRVVFVLKDVSMPVYERLSAFFLNLARDQNRVYVLSRKKLDIPFHDNIFQIRVPGWLFYLGVLFFLWDNSHRSVKKHYNLIFVSGSKLRGFIFKFSFLRKYTIMDFDFSDSSVECKILGIVKDKKYE